MPLTHSPAKSQKTAAESSHHLLIELDGLFTGDHVNASGGIQYAHKNFGRDSAISMLFLLDALGRGLGKQDEKDARRVIGAVIESLVRWQGQKPAKIGKRWRKNAEEPGKIHHEAGPVKIDELGLADKWQENDDKDSDMLVYYGSIDSTPLFVRLVCEYAEHLNKADSSGQTAYHLLLKRVHNYRGRQVTIAEALVDAVSWIYIQLASSDLGLLEYQRRPGQEQGLLNQTWKDSLTSYVHSSGQLANTKRPIASIEVQALAYDALAEAVELFEGDQLLSQAARVSQTQLSSWRHQMSHLQDGVFKHFWQEKKKHFVQAIDRHPGSGQLRQISTPSSNEFHLLNSRLFDNISQTQKQVYVESLARQAMSDDFLTDAGIRCRAKSAYRLVDFADYHGSWSVWPWESHWIALGLRRQGFNKLADEIDTRILNAFAVSGEYLEYYLVNPKNGQAYYHFKPLHWTTDPKAGNNSIVASTLPDKPQTWSVLSAIDIRATLSKAQPARAGDSWHAKLEREVLLKTKHETLITSSAQISRLREASHDAVIDRMRGREADAHYHRMVGSPDPVLLPAV
jgi:glycogen debranching enzyme